MLILTGCMGRNGGGWAHYVGQEKCRPITGWISLANALDGSRPPRTMIGTAYWYMHTDQWRFDGYAADALTSPLAEGHLAGMHTADTGFLVDTRGELPDYLPMVLEYAAIVDPVDGGALLQEYRSSVELLRLALAERGTPYGGVVTAVCSTLPGPSPADRKAVMAMAAVGPPTEMVGLELPTGARLLPMGDSR